MSKTSITEPPVLLAPEYRREIQRCLAPPLTPFAARLILFGSRARGDAHPGSDIDIAVAAGQPLPREVLAAARECLEESSIPVRVDLVDLAGADPELASAVSREGVPWDA